MKHVQVEFNTRTQGIKSSTKELRRRWVKSPGFQRLLKKAAHDKLRGQPVTLRASNKRAQRALELAVYKVGVSEFELPTMGHASRQVYLMRRGKAWGEVHKAVAVKAMRETTPDTLAVMPLWVYSPNISWRAAAKLDARTAPETVYLAPETVEFSENRERESAHPNIFEEDASSYNDAGELETPTERRERLEREGISLARPERFEDAWRPLPLKKTREAAIFKRNPNAAWYEPSEVIGFATPEKVQVKPLPAAPYYYATEAQMDKETQAELSAERKAQRERRALLADDEAERLLCAELGEALADDEDLEAEMLEPWEVWEHYTATN